MKMKEQERLEKIQKEVEDTKKELRYYENRVKILEHQIPKLTRKERTHRLCTRGAMLEKYLQDPDILRDEDVSLFLKKVFELRGTYDLLADILSKARLREQENITNLD